MIAQPYSTYMICYFREDLEKQLKHVSEKL